MVMLIIDLGRRKPDFLAVRLTNQILKKNLDFVVNGSRKGDSLKRQMIKCLIKSGENGKRHIITRRRIQFHSNDNNAGRT